MSYKEIEEIKLSRLPNANHMAYMLQSIQIIQSQAEIATEFAGYLTSLITAYQKEDEVMEKISFSEMTGEISQADDERDNRLDSFNRVWRAYLDFPDAVKAAAAERIKRYWRVHKVDSSAQFDRETGQMINFIQDMRQYCAEAVETLGLTQLLNEMEHWNNEVNRLLLVRNEEYVDNRHIAVSEARKETNHRYLSLVKAINAKAFLAEGSADATRYDRVIDLMNQNIERTKLEVFKKKGQAGVNGGATPAPAPGNTPEDDENTTPDDNNTNTGNDNTGSGDNNNNGGGTTPPGSVPTNPQPGTDEDPDL